MRNEAYLFLIFMINGFLIGVLFDTFRSLRKSFKTSDLITYIEDIIFWILTGLLTLYFIFKYNNGEIRLYIFFGILLGILIYILTISKYIIKFSVLTITISKTIVSKSILILTYPLKLIAELLKKILFRPISFIFINLREIFTKNNQFFKKILKNINKTTKK